MKKIALFAILATISCSLTAQRIDTMYRPKKVMEKIVFAKPQKLTKDRVMIVGRQRILFIMTPRTEQYAWVTRRQKN